MERNGRAFELQSHPIPPSNSRCTRFCSYQTPARDLSARVEKNMSSWWDDNYWALGALRRAYAFYSAFFVYQTLFVAKSSGAIGSVYEGEQDKRQQWVMKVVGNMSWVERTFCPRLCPVSRSSRAIIISSHASRPYRFGC